MPRVASVQQRSSLGGESFAPECISRIYAEIRIACRTGGLTTVDTEDVTSEIWLWLLRRPQRAAESPLGIRGVAHNYIRRYWRKRSRQDTVREQASIPFANAVRAAKPRSSSRR